MANQNATPVELTITAFAQYLMSCVPDLVQAIEEFPTGNIGLKYPSVSVSHDDNPQFTNEMPYEHRVCNGDGSQLDVVWICGQWDYKIQLDIWTRSKPERNKLFAQVFQALNPKINPMGLSLQLPDYYGLWTRFDVQSFKHMDAEQGAQRGEWRTMITLQVSLKQALEETGFAITKPIVNELDILDTNQVIGT